MIERGQLALDFLLGLLVLFVVLNAFQPVLDSFSNVQKELAIYQQLENNADLAWSMLIMHNWYFFDSSFDGVNPSLIMEGTTRLFGHAFSSPIYTFEKSQGIDCNIDKSYTAVTFTVPVASSGLDHDVVVQRKLSLDPSLDTVMILFKGCFEPFEIFVSN